MLENPSSSMSSKDAYNLLLFLDFEISLLRQDEPDSMLIFLLHSFADPKEEQLNSGESSNSTL
jgi:hypothetical protein